MYNGFDRMLIDKKEKNTSTIIFNEKISNLEVKTKETRDKVYPTKL